MNWDRIGNIWVRVTSDIRWTVVLYAVIAFSLYSPGIYGGFVHDFLGWALTYESSTIADLKHCFGYNGLHHLLHLLFYNFYCLFGFWALPWFVLFTALHVVNAGLVYRFMRVLHIQWTDRSEPIWYFVGGLFFLLSPYQAEAVVWKVCLHYLLTCTFALLCLTAYLRYLNSGSLRQLALAILAYVPCLFLIELSFAVPILVLLLTFFWQLKRQRIDLILYVKGAGAFLVLLLGYLLLSNAVIGSFIGHYGSEKHLQFPIDVLSGNTAMYFGKYALLTRYWPFQLKHWLYDQAIQAPTAYVWLAMLLLALVFFFVRLKKWHPETQLIWMLLALFFVALLPVMNLYMAYQHWVEGDRYGYLAAAFFYPFAALLFARWKTWRWVAVLAYLGFLIYALVQTVAAMGQAGKITRTLVDDFRWWGRDKVVILSIGDNFKGSFMYQVYGSDSTFEEALKLMRHEFDGDIDHVLLYNMANRYDATTARWISRDTIHVEFNQWGNWWWKDGLGATDFEMDDYRVEMVPKGYHLILKNRKPNTAYIFQDGDAWRELKSEAFDESVGKRNGYHQQLMFRWKADSHGDSLAYEDVLPGTFSTESVLPVTDRNIYRYSGKEVRLEALVNNEASGIGNAILVLLVRREGETIFWEMKNIAEGHTSGDWLWIDNVHELPELAIGDEIRLHIWNDSDTTVRLGKMQLYTQLPKWRLD